MIYLQPHSGLANRIRVIVSGMAFSDVVNQQITLIWKKDKSLFCDFTELFKADEKIICKNYNWWWSGIINSFQYNDIFRQKITNLFSIDFSLFDKDVEEFVWSTGTNNINLNMLPKKVRNYYFSTCHEFYFDRAYLKFLRSCLKIEFRNTIMWKSG